MLAVDPSLARIFKLNDKIDIKFLIVINNIMNVNQMFVIGHNTYFKLNLNSLFRLYKLNLSGFTVVQGLNI